MNLIRGKNRNNKTGYKNVHFDKQTKLYRVSKYIEGKKVQLKSFVELEDAVSFARKMNQYDLNIPEQRNEFEKWYNSTVQGL